MSKLETNTASLQEILNTVNTLPEAAAGGSLGEITVYTGDSAPTDTVGADGDIYLVVSGT